MFSDCFDKKKTYRLLWNHPSEPNTCPNLQTNNFVKALRCADRGGEQQKVHVDWPDPSRVKIWRVIKRQLINNNMARRRIKLMWLVFVSDVDRWSTSSSDPVKAVDVAVMLSCHLKLYFIEGQRDVNLIFSIIPSSLPFIE